MSYQGIENTIKPPKNIFWRDPKFIIQNHPMHKEPPPNFKPSEITNLSISADRFNIAYNNKITPIVAQVIDQNNIIKTLHNMNLTPKIDGCRRGRTFAQLHTKRS